MVEEQHGKKGCGSAAEKRKKQQAGFRDSVLMFGCLKFIQGKDGEGNDVDGCERNEPKEIHGGKVREK